MVRRKRDRNQADIIKALENQGAVVIPLCELAGREPRAKGVPDLLVYHGKLRLIELKSGKGTLGPDQIEFLRKVPFDVARSPAQALRIIGVDDERERKA